MLVSYQQKTCKLTGFPDKRSCWWGTSRESCKHSGFPDKRSCWWITSRESCKHSGFPDKRSCWWGISRELCKYTGFPDQRPGWWDISRKSCKLTGFPERRSGWWLRWYNVPTAAKKFLISLKFIYIITLYDKIYYLLSIVCTYFDNYHNNRHLKY